MGVTTLSELNNLSKRSKILITVLALSLAGGFFCWGLVYSKITTVPEILVQTVTRDFNHYIERPTVEVVEVEKVVEKKVIEEVPVIKYVEVEKEIPVKLEPFESEEALIEWLHADRTDKLPGIHS